MRSKKKGSISRLRFGSTVDGRTGLFLDREANMFATLTHKARFPSTLAKGTSIRWRAVRVPSSQRNTTTS